jgi:hypothetical protein
MNFTDLRLKIRHFFRKNKKIIFIAVIIWLVVFLINQLLKLYTPEKELETTYEPHTSVMSSSSSVPKKYQSTIEDKIKQYVEYCNNNDFDKAYNMLSADCKKYAYPDFNDYVDYVLKIMPTKKLYSIQNYSNLSNMYIYSVAYTDDFLATGLTNSKYSYTEEKMTFIQDDDGELQMSVGNFIKHEDIKVSTENEYLKIDVRERNVNYETETYTVRFTNRTNYSIVISDYFEDDEILLQLNKEYREAEQGDAIVLLGNETKDVDITFSKYADDNDTSKSIGFDSIRVLDKYYGENVEKDVAENAIANAVAKFSMQISVDK